MIADDVLEGDTEARELAHQAGVIAMSRKPGLPDLTIALASMVEALYYPVSPPTAAIEVLGLVAAVLFEEEAQHAS